MVKNATSYSGSGLRDWLVQRVTAVVVAAYVIFLTGYFLANQHVTYSQWEALFSHNVMKVSTLVALLSVMLHAWVGMWTIFTDYVKPACIRLFLEIIVILALVGFFVWGVILVWSV